MPIENQVKEKMEELIFDAIDEINEELLEDEKIEKRKDAELFGEDGVLDSLGLVNLILAIEQRVFDKFGISITMADENAMSQEDSPFKSVESLSNYTIMLIKEDPNGR